MDSDGVGAIVFFLLAAGPGAGIALYGWIQARYRNRAARYMPERVVHHTVTKLDTDDAFAKKIVTRDSSIEGRNDWDPSVRAPKWRAIEQ
jgi:hypothetical protein